MTDSEKLDLVIEEIAKLNGSFVGVGNKLETMEGRFGTIENRLETMEGRFETMENKLETVEKQIGSLETEVRTIKVTLENETNRNIKVIAEGHLDLSRKLNEAVRIVSDIKAKQEIQDIFINVHDNKLKAL